MKNERRHELEKNELADRLGTGIEAAQPMLPIILGGIAIVIVGALGWGLYSSNAKRKASLAWTDYYFNLAGTDADAFKDVANDFPGTAAAGWAHLTAGFTLLEKGIDTLYRDRPEGEDLLDSAIAEFEAALSGKVSEELTHKANYGLGQAHESLGLLDEASGYYEKVAGSLAHPGLVKDAQSRMQFINSSEGKEFYAWFVKLDPQPDAPIELPSDLSLPPMTPDLQFGTPAGEVGDIQLDPASLPPLPNNELPTGGEVPEGQVPPADVVPDTVPEVEVGAEGGESADGSAEEKNSAPEETSENPPKG